LGDETINSVRALKTKKIQAHFQITENQWREFQRKIQDLGYSTASEFLRDKIRQVLKEAGHPHDS